MALPLPTCTSLCLSARLSYQHYVSSHVHASPCCRYVSQRVCRSLGMPVRLSTTRYVYVSKLAFSYGTFLCVPVGLTACSLCGSLSFIRLYMSVYQCLYAFLPISLPFCLSLCLSACLSAFLLSLFLSIWNFLSAFSLL
jgi:hypothetical protein